MDERTAGIHHVTAISSDPQVTLDFYTRVLGLRLVKRTVNFDDPSTYHLYFGDETGSPGTVLTFFPIRNAPRGRVGRGQIGATGFAVPPGAIDFWMARLDDHDVDVDAPGERFDKRVLRLRDGDGQTLELVETGSAAEPWANGPIPAEHAIRGFAGVVLLSATPRETGRVLERLGFEVDGEGADRTRYRAAGDRAAVVDVLDAGDVIRRRQGAGTVHHVAFRAPNEEVQLAWRDELIGAGLSVTPQKDRQYFTSVYFREPGGVLFEIATDGPGFTRDEPVESLGSELKLPPWLEEDREFITERIPRLEVDVPAEAD